MEIDEQNSMNIIEIKKKQSEILVWKKSEGIPNDIDNEDYRKKVPEEMKNLMR